MPEELSATEFSRLMLETVEERCKETRRDLIQEVYVIVNEFTSAMVSRPPARERIPVAVAVALKALRADFSSETHYEANRVLTEYLRNAVPTKEENAQESSGDGESVQAQILPDEHPGEGEIRADQVGNHEEA